MIQTMYEELDRFFASKTIHDVDRNTFLTCNLVDRVKKITISLIFLRDWDSLETDSYNSVIIQNKGAVFTFPCYWVSIPKELAIPYIEYIIDEFYEEEVSKWNIGDNTNNNTGNNGMCPIPNGGGCRPPKPSTTNCQCGII